MKNLSLLKKDARRLVLEDAQFEGHYVVEIIPFLMSTMERLGRMQEPILTPEIIKSIELLPLKGKLGSLIIYDLSRVSHAITTTMLTMQRCMGVCIRGQTRCVPFRLVGGFRLFRNGANWP